VTLWLTVIGNVRDVLEGIGGGKHEWWLR